MKDIAEVHPVAALFPTLPEDELADLATSIKNEGLLNPIVLDDQGRILDGRNRYAACELAGVKPTYVDYDGDNPNNYAATVNAQRRQMSKGQQAMVAARFCSETEQTQRAAAAIFGVTVTRLGVAATVLEWASELADGVVGGFESLDTAYKTAQQRKAAASNDEAQLAQLRQNAADLADLVFEQRMTLAEANAAAKERAELHKAAIGRAARRLEGVCSGWHQLRDLRDNPERDEILDVLAPSDVEIVLRIEREDLTWRT